MLKNLLKGIVIGIAGIIPGLSGGVLAMLFGLYDKLIYCVGNLFKDIKNNLLFLTPVLLGIGIGFVLFGNIQKYLLSNYHDITLMGIVGLIIGTVPALLNNSGIKKKQLLSFPNIGLLTICFILGLVMSYSGEGKVITDNIALEFNFKTIISLFLIGFIMAGSHVIPGISGTVILVSLGFYGIMLTSISNIKNLVLFFSGKITFSTILYDFIVLIPIGIGLFIGCIIFSKLMSFLLTKYNDLTYCCIIGFVIGSVPSLVPAFGFEISSLLKLAIMFICFGLSYCFTLISPKNQAF